jgi:hypothetical protein
MQKQNELWKLQEKYIKLSRDFLNKMQSGIEYDTLQPLRTKIAEVIARMDDLEKEIIAERDQN